MKKLNNLFNIFFKLITCVFNTKFPFAFQAKIFKSPGYK